MDRERAFREELHPDEVRIEADPLVRLLNVRVSTLDHRLSLLRELGRMPRVCLYALAVDGQEPTHSLNAARDFALQQNWQVGVHHHFTDRFGATDPLTRTGWSLVRHQIRAGYADGVVALTHSVISPHLDEYALQLDLIEQHLGFVALVTAETAGGQR
ncbi:hypothetical protein [Streptomyces graminilatus]|uniref:hypothetical protein n=1 Tax=Streptomyces graminilatus TaxID=1464070 RepID=UPI000ACA149E|nr:hypothetical protein [Streptomyces graminilatus]